ncbi:DUF2817 domain-containing protein [bacterium]|nr:DUF2817 domain-containing protein [bacterium]
MKILKETLSKLGNKIELLGNDNHKPILVIGVFHGDEPQGDFLIKEYLKNNQNSEMLFIPCLNPDGMKLNQRQNSNGVDLNRNFPTNNWELVVDTTFYGGEAPNSEIETKFMVKIIEEYNPKLILSLHAPFCTVNFDGDAIKYAEKISEIINYPVQEDIGYPTPGSFGTYCGVERNIPTITLELDENIDVKRLVKPVHKIFDYINSVL